MLVSTEAARSALAAYGSFRTFLDRYVQTYQYERGSEEVILDLYLNEEGRRNVCRAHAVAHTHPALPARPMPMRHGALHGPSVPAYARQPAARVRIPPESEYRVPARLGGWVEWVDDDVMRHGGAKRRRGQQGDTGDRGGRRRRGTEDDHDSRRRTAWESVQEGARAP